jgi:predicted GNAT family acetyltransferase
MSFTDKRDAARFELAVDGQVAFANYRRSPDLIEILHVEAPPALRGTGAAGKLMEEIMEAARLDGAKIRPICGYAFAWMRRHPTHHDLLA